MSTPVARLSEIAENLDNLFTCLSHIVGFDVAVVNRERVALVGTGAWRKNVGTRRPAGSYFDYTLQTGEASICTEPKFSSQCYKCTMRNRCPYSFTGAWPIVVNGEVVGLVGYLGYEVSHREVFIARQRQLMNCIEALSKLISNLIKDFPPGIPFYSPAFQEVLNELDHGILWLDSSLSITYSSKSACTMLACAPEELGGKTIGEFFPHLAKDLKKLLTAKGRSSEGGVVKRTLAINPRLQGKFTFDFSFGAGIGVLILQPRSSANVQHSGLPSQDKSYGHMTEFGRILGESEAIRSAKLTAAKWAGTDQVVLITGETGVGKELFAEAIHNASARKDGPFVAVNCAAIPETLAESELFGYEQGSFSGAKRGGKLGKFEVANGGTLFLDEVGELPLLVQSKLLRAIEQKMIEKLGSTQPKRVDVRIIAATNRDLLALVENGQFRRDLYYRLSVLPLEIPPLRDRREDIPIILSHYLEVFGRPQGKSSWDITPDLMTVLLSYDWPGNVRELINVAQYLVANHQSGPLGVESLPPYMLRNLRNLASSSQSTSDAFQHQFSEIESSSNLQGRKGAIQIAEEIVIRQALARYGSNTSGKRQVAASLGMSLATLYRKLKQYGLDGKPRHKNVRND